MIPGVTVGRNQHFSNSTSFSYGRPPASTVRIIRFIATDGITIAMLGTRSTTLSANSTNVYYTNDFGQTWNAVPGTPPSTTGFIAGTNNNMGGILYADGKWIVSLGNGVVYYTTDLSTTWSSWTSSGTASTTDFQYGPIFYNGGSVSPYYVLDIANGGAPKVANSLTSWTLDAGSGTRSNTEDFVFGKLNGVNAWFTINTTAIDIFSSGSPTTLGTRTVKTYPSATFSSRCLAYWAEKGLWISGGSGSLLYTSPDSGTDFSWTARTFPSIQDPTSIVVIPGVGVIVGTSPTANTASLNQKGEIVFSKDGTTWTILTQFDDSTRSYGFGYYPVLFNGAVLYPQSENETGTTPIATADAVNYKSILIADR